MEWEPVRFASKEDDRVSPLTPDRAHPILRVPQPAARKRSGAG